MWWQNFTANRFYKSFLLFLFKWFGEQACSLKLRLSGWSYFWWLTRTSRLWRRPGIISFVLESGHAGGNDQRCHESSAFRVGVCNGLTSTHFPSRSADQTTQSLQHQQQHPHPSTDGSEADHADRQTGGHAGNYTLLVITVSVSPISNTV